jgi:uncharacterized protein YdhG (YjbR/CyaY superfamily)
MAITFETVDDYIASFPAATKEVLQQVRQAIARAIPGAEESIRYNMPVVGRGGTYVVHFAGWKRHIGMYPIPGFADDLEREVAPYRAAKDTVRFPLSKPIPDDLIERMTAAIVAQRLDRT